MLQFLKGDEGGRLLKEFLRVIEVCVLFSGIVKLGKFIGLVGTVFLEFEATFTKFRDTQNN